MIGDRVSARTATAAVEAPPQRRTRSACCAPTHGGRTERWASASELQSASEATSKPKGECYAHPAGVPKVLRRALAQVPAGRAGTSRKRLPALRAGAPNAEPSAPVTRSADRRLVAVLCPSCHAKNDTPQRLAMTRRNWAKRRGQLWLSEEIQWGPFPVRTWPLRLRQMKLF